ncbi:hypothetical protein BHAOGJBA_1206 [Methylobacterium hispanicum]|uniref:LigA protein n=1 Tax=Methylobacterium hispanicum TaxID=270350 RepID=A0AAV4ZIM3_9HYPH|nr:hypothetical protein [Methylobacterium hispanicum]GJD87701.1 hypothetical protein BHAOGJBA_1206 [Methylobacterium hispanicum]
MILTVSYAYPMRGRLPRQRTDRPYYVADQVMVRCAAPAEHEAPVVLRWHQATPLGTRPDAEAPVVEFRLFEGHLYRTAIRKEPWSDADRKVLTPHGAVALAADREHPHNVFLGGAGELGEFGGARNREVAGVTPADEVEDVIVSVSGRERVLAAIHAFAERTLWIGNEVMVRSGEPVYLLEEAWGERARRVKVRTTDDFGVPSDADYPCAEQIVRADAVHDVLAAASRGEGEYDPDDPSTFRHILPGYVEVLDPSVLSYVHDQTPVFRHRVKRAADALCDRIHLEPVGVITAWAVLRDATRNEDGNAGTLADAARGYVAAVQAAYPAEGRRLNWRAETVSREVEHWEYAPLAGAEPASSGPRPS